MNRFSCNVSKLNFASLPVIDDEWGLSFLIHEKEFLKNQRIQCDEYWVQHVTAYLNEIKS